MKLFKVKLTEGHSAEHNQIIDGYLGNSFGDGKIQIYTRGEAIKKAKLFGGKIELHVCNPDNDLPQSVFDLLNMGCKIEFPSGYILEGDTVNKYIDCKYDIEGNTCNDGCHDLSPEGVKFSLWDAASYAENLTEIQQ